MSNLHKKARLIGLSVILTGTFSLTSCNDTSPDEEKILDIYNAAKQNGYTGTYEEWLESIKGEKGPQGEKGDKGEQGLPGQDGKSIVSVLKTSTQGNIDTYTIT